MGLAVFGVADRDVGNKRGFAATPLGIEDNDLVQIVTLRRH
jgi:hypothetical protein